MNKSIEPSSISPGSTTTTKNGSLVPDGQRNHDQLGEDESREGDRADVDELVLEQKERPHHDDAAWKDKQQTSRSSSN